MAGRIRQERATGQTFFAKVYNNILNRVGYAGITLYQDGTTAPGDAFFWNNTIAHSNATTDVTRLTRGILVRACSTTGGCVFKNNTVHGVSDEIMVIGSGATAAVTLDHNLYGDSGVDLTRWSATINVNAQPTGGTTDGCLHGAGCFADDIGQNEIDALEAILGTTVSRDARQRLIDVGPRWTVAQLPNAQAVLSCRPDLQRLTEQDARAKTTGVVIFGEHEPGALARIEVRAFAPACGVNEDPVCGSGNGCVAALIRESAQTSRFGNEFVSSQDMALGRAGLLRVTVGNERIQVGGMSVTCIDGQLSF